MEAKGNLFICKHDGQIVPFQAVRVIESIVRAAKDGGIRDITLAFDIGQSIAEEILREFSDKVITTKDIRDRVSSLLVLTRQDEVNNAYLSYMEKLHASRSIIEVIIDRPEIFNFVPVSEDNLEIARWSKTRFSSDLARILNIVSQEADTYARDVERILISSKVNPISVSYLIELVNLILHSHGVEEKILCQEEISVPKSLNSSTAKRIYSPEFLKSVSRGDFISFGAQEPHKFPEIVISVSDVKEGVFELSAACCSFAENVRELSLKTASACKLLLSKMAQSVELLGTFDLYDSNFCSPNEFAREWLLTLSSVLQNEFVRKLRLVIDASCGLDLIIPFLQQYFGLKSANLPSITILCKKDTSKSDIVRIAGLFSAFHERSAEIELRCSSLQKFTPVEIISLSVFQFFLKKDNDRLREVLEVSSRGVKERFLRIRQEAGWDSFVNSAWLDRLFQEIEFSCEGLVELVGMQEYVEFQHCGGMFSHKGHLKVLEVIDAVQDILSDLSLKYRLQQSISMSSSTLTAREHSERDAEVFPQLIPFFFQGSCRTIPFGDFSDKRRLENLICVQRVASFPVQIDVSKQVESQSQSILLDMLLDCKIQSLILMNQSIHRKEE